MIPRSLPAGLWPLTILAGETAAAAAATIGFRTRMMAAAAGDPAALSDPEFSLMGHEKVTAAVEAGTAVAMELPALQMRLGAWIMGEGLRAAFSFMEAAQSGTVFELARTQARFIDGCVAAGAALGASLADDGIGMAAAGMRPVHRAASRNARRLRRQAAKSRG